MKDKNQNDKSVHTIIIQKKDDKTNRMTNCKKIVQNSKRKHRLKKNFVCTGYENCSMTFSRAEHLARHIRKHTGEKPFQCDICLKFFSRIDNLKQHKDSVHSKKTTSNTNNSNDNKNKSPRKSSETINNFSNDSSTSHMSHDNSDNHTKIILIHPNMTPSKKSKTLHKTLHISDLIHSDKENQLAGVPVFKTEDTQNIPLNASTHDIAINTTLTASSSPTIEYSSFSKKKVNGHLEVNSTQEQPHKQTLIDRDKDVSSIFSKKYIPSPIINLQLSKKDNRVYQKNNTFDSDVHNMSNIHPCDNGAQPIVYSCQLSPLPPPRQLFPLHNPQQPMVSHFETITSNKYLASNQTIIQNSNIYSRNNIIINEPLRYSTHTQPFQYSPLNQVGQLVPVSSDDPHSKSQIITHYKSPMLRDQPHVTSNLIENTNNNNNNNFDRNSQLIPNSNDYLNPKHALQKHYPPSDNQ